MPGIGRRRALMLGAAGLLPLSAAGYGAGRLLETMMTGDAQTGRAWASDAASGRLSARPGSPTDASATGEAGPTGLQPLGLGDQRDGLLYVPTGYRPDRPAPLVLTLHGAGRDARRGIEPLLGLADAFGLLLLAVDSRGRTWDVVLGGYGPDVAFLDRALAQTFARYAVDASRVAVEGFSDGASYALSIGIANGDLFSHILGFSPGFAAPEARAGQPRVFVSHGTGDQILPIDRCSRVLVPMMRQAGYDVTYREFDGPHVVPPEIVQEALAWFTGAPPADATRG
ncbi:MAG: phospholipase [Chloroflexota bacterium]